MLYGYLLAVTVSQGAMAVTVSRVRWAVTFPGVLGVTGCQGPGLLRFHGGLAVTVSRVTWRSLFRTVLGVRRFPIGGLAVTVPTVAWGLTILMEGLHAQIRWRTLCGDRIEASLCDRAG